MKINQYNKTIEMKAAPSRKTPNNKHTPNTNSIQGITKPKILFNTNIPKEVLSQIKPGAIKVYIISKWINKVGIFRSYISEFRKVSSCLSHEPNRNGFYLFIINTVFKNTHN